MHSAEEKLSNAASAAKEHFDIYKAKVEEKVENATARTKEEKERAHECRKAKEAEAKMKLHEAKAEHAAEKLHSHHIYGVETHGPQPIVTAAPVPGTTVPTYPLGGHPPGHHMTYK
ncbi:late embryogenesis abundant protein 6-like [Actinidia eriantha]|uniref:late embryogenesis abundant protein 6-like n=1 Tax=Actinidia eriantha TaxID=165200 RepID=UPI002584A0B4|nr:late embryogenesis abundant protein 6-like [Actinidia eriantha]